MLAYPLNRWISRARILPTSFLALDVIRQLKVDYCKSRVEVFFTELTEHFSNPVLVQDRRRWMRGAKEPEMRSWRMTDAAMNRRSSSFPCLDFDLGFVIIFLPKNFPPIVEMNLRVPTRRGGQKMLLVLHGYFGWSSLAASFCTYSCNN